MASPGSALCKFPQRLPTAASPPMPCFSALRAHVSCDAPGISVLVVAPLLLAENVPLESCPMSHPNTLTEDSVAWLLTAGLRLVAGVSLQGAGSG